MGHPLENPSFDAERTLRSEDVPDDVRSLPQWFPILKGVKGILEGWKCSLTEGHYVLGRGRNVHIMIWDSEVSREHAIISRTLSGYVIHDMGSLNGTFVNDVKVPRALLVHGDVIKLGETVFRFLWDGELSLPDGHAARVSP